MLRWYPNKCPRDPSTLAISRTTSRAVGQSAPQPPRCRGTVTESSPLARRSSRSSVAEPPALSRSTTVVCHFRVSSRATSIGSPCLLFCAVVVSSVNVIAVLQSWIG
ncbi:Uncharacterised protein [Mycobacteroides abscessus subsp. abscessus]|nr:Uncharacterised protein [Mycobacteroides abscessus subsp. abscessus]